MQAWVQVGESGKGENIELFEVPDKYISTNNMECASLVAKHIYKVKSLGGDRLPQGEVVDKQNMQIPAISPPPPPRSASP